MPKTTTTVNMWEEDKGNFTEFIKIHLLPGYLHGFVFYSTETCSGGTPKEDPKGTVMFDLDGEDILLRVEKGKGKGCLGKLDSFPVLYFIHQIDSNRSIYPNFIQFVVVGPLGTVSFQLNFFFPPRKLWLGSGPRRV